MTINAQANKFNYLNQAGEVVASVDNEGAIQGLKFKTRNNGAGYIDLTGSMMSVFGAVSKNIEFGKDVKAQCGVGCIGCGVCARLAPNEFALEGKLAHAVYSDDFDIEKAKMAAAKCPAKCIIINEKYLTPEEPKEEKEAVNA